MRSFVVVLSAMCLVFALAVTPVMARVVDVKMLTEGASGKMVFEPALIKINPGDTVRFIAVDKGHNVETIDGFIPAAATSFQSKSGQDFEVKLTKPGVYGIKCKPHFWMGMVGLIVVGKDTHNLTDINKVRMGKKARDRFAAALKGL